MKPEDRYFLCVVSSDNCIYIADEIQAANKREAENKFNEIHDIKLVDGVDSSEQEPIYVVAQWYKKA